MAISTYRYQSRREQRAALRLRIREIAQARVRYGYRKVRVLLNREGWKVGKKLVYRLYREEGLTLPFNSHSLAEVAHVCNRAQREPRLLLKPLRIARFGPSERFSGIG